MSAARLKLNPELPTPNPSKGTQNKLTSVPKFINMWGMFHPPVHILYNERIAIHLISR